MSMKRSECVDKCTANRECSFVSNPPAAYNRHNYCLNQSHTLPSKLGLATKPSSPKLQPCTAWAKGDHHSIALVLNLYDKFKGSIAHSYLPDSRLLWGISLPLATSHVAITQPITSVTRCAAPLLCGLGLWPNYHPPPRLGYYQSLRQSPSPLWWLCYSCSGW